MRQHFPVSRRAVLAGSVAAVALTLPAGAFGQARQRFPAMVKVSWQEAEGDPGLRRRLITAVTAAMAEAGSDLGATWVFADA